MIAANFTQDPTRIDSRNGSVSRFYPNPVNNALKIELHDKFLKGAVIQLFDNIGRLILNNKVQGLKHTLDMGNLSPGMYLIKVSDMNGVTIIERITKK